jgi:hypothetical protein
VADNVAGVCRTLVYGASNHIYFENREVDSLLFGRMDGKRSCGPFASRSLNSKRSGGPFAVPKMNSKRSKDRLQNGRLRHDRLKESLKSLFFSALHF